MCLHTLLNFSDSIIFTQREKSLLRKLGASGPKAYYGTVRKTGHVTVIEFTCWLRSFASGEYVPAISEVDLAPSLTAHLYVQVLTIQRTPALRGTTAVA